MPGTNSNDTGVNSSITIIDDLGRSVSFTKSVSHIASLSSDATTLLLVIGAGNALTGVSGTPLTFPYMAEKMPNATLLGGTYGTTPDVEQIVTLNPDVVILMTTTNSIVADKLNQTHIPYIYVDGYKLADIPKEVSLLGKLTGQTENASKYNSFYQKYQDIIKDRIGSTPESLRPTVYYEGGSSFSTVGNTSGGDSLIKMAGGRNIAGDINVPWPQVSPEWVIQQNPDVFIKIAYPGSLNNSTIQDIQAVCLNQSTLSPINAIKNGRVYVINQKITYNSIGIVALMYMAKAIYPDKFSDIDPGEMLSEYDREFLPGSTIDNPYYPALSDNNSK
ncbi:ABC transporter substrate-binding protein [uncultured Methanospirillum sp.]|uniref:ABC transporter substrate-binding protein n=1 Tax=uncultured Methanospirillum sp. TaxID=262503 RepID=UPI0029C9112A|nr:ABC transporter substrate-binding protein [uncultured Methanospirillum sp.]